MDAVASLCNAAIIAFARLAAEDGMHYKQLDAVRISVLLKAVINANLDNLIIEWGEAVSANVGGGWLAATLNTQAADLARIAYVQYRQEETQP